MKIYHGTGQETIPFTMYFSSRLVEAKEFALGLTTDGDYNEESFIYETEIDENHIAVEEDFLIFDALAYNNPELDGYDSDVIYNPESGWYIVKNPTITLVAQYRNEL